MTPEGIKQRVRDESDAVLRERIDKSLLDLELMLRNGIEHTVRLPTITGETAEVVWHTCLAALKERAFELHKNISRTMALDRLHDLPPNCVSGQPPTSL